MKNPLCQQDSNLFRHFGRKHLLEVAGMIEGGYQSRLQNVTCYSRVVFFIFKNTWICQCLSLLFWYVPIFKWVSAMKCKWWQRFSGYLSAKGFAVILQAPESGISLIFLTETWAWSQCLPDPLCPQCYVILQMVLSCTRLSPPTSPFLLKVEHGPAMPEEFKLYSVVLSLILIYFSFILNAVV